MVHMQPNLLHYRNHVVDTRSTNTYTSTKLVHNLNGQSEVVKEPVRI